MADKSGSNPSEEGRLKVSSSQKFYNIDFELSEEQGKALMECLKKNGKISLRLNRKGISQLPGRGLLDDVDGELID